MPNDNSPDWGHSPGDGFAGRPQPNTVVDPRTVRRQTLTDTVRELDVDPGGGREPEPCDVYTLPESLVDSRHFRGTTADRTFGLREPTTADVKKLIKSEAQMEEAAPRFVAMLGVVVGHDNDGNEVIEPQPIGFREAQSWWARLNWKAKQAVTQMFMQMIMPSEDEGNSLRSSRRSVG